MLQSLKYSYRALRFGLVAVFLWFGVDKFIHPDYWLNAWTPAWFIGALAKIHVTGNQFMYFNGLVEVLIATSILTTIFIRLFAFLAIVFLIGVIAVHGFSEVIVRDLGLIGGLAALVLWPERRVL